MRFVLVRQMQHWTQSLVTNPVNLSPSPEGLLFFPFVLFFWERLIGLGCLKDGVELHNKGECLGSWEAMGVRGFVKWG